MGQWFPSGVRKVTRLGSGADVCLVSEKFPSCIFSGTCAILPRHIFKKHGEGTARSHPCFEPPEAALQNSVLSSQLPLWNYGVGVVLPARGYPQLCGGLRLPPITTKGVRGQCKGQLEQTLGQLSLQWFVGVLRDLLLLMCSSGSRNPGLLLAKQPAACILGRVSSKVRSLH